MKKVKNVSGQADALGERIPFQTKPPEQISYGLYFFGQLVFYILVTMFLMPYFTDIGIPTLTVAAILLVVKVWDAVNDPVFGGIVDRVQFRKGKFMPWIRLSVIVIPITTIFLFAAVPDLPLTAKVIWVTVGYILWDTAYTICDVPIFGLVMTMTDQQKERNHLMSLTRVFTMAGALLVSTGLPLFRRSLGGWLPTSVVLAVIGAVCMLPILFTAKERHLPDVSEKGISLKEMIRFLGSNKYLLIYYSAVIVMGSSSIAGSLGMYIARYNLGNEALMGVISLSVMPATLVTTLAMPFIVRKVDKFILMLVAVTANAVVGVVFFFVGYHNFAAFLTMSIIRGIAVGLITFLINMFTPDMVEYGRYKTGIPAAGVAFAMQTFSVKLQGALATSLAALTLSLIGFAEGEGAVQAAGFTDKLWFINCIIPVVGMVVALPILTRYKLRDNLVAVMSKCNNGEMPREEADKLLKGKF